MPPPKSATTCVQCRARKVRCPGEPQCCSNCRRLDFACSFAESDRDRKSRSATSKASASASATAPATIPATASATVTRPPSSSRSSSSSSSNAQLPLLKKRRPLACIPCRTAKSRCTGERPACDGCRSRSRDCTYPDSTRRSRPRSHTHSHPYSRSSAVPKKARLHLRRQPRSHPLPVEVNAGAESEVEVETASGLQQTPAAPRRPQTPSSAPGRSWSSLDLAQIEHSPSSPAVPTSREQLHMLNDFFRHIYPLPGSAFLSEVSVMSRCLDGSIDDALLLAISALTATALKYPKYHPEHAVSWVQRAEDLVWKHVDHPTIFRTQALLLSVLCRIEMGHFKRGYMLLAMASRSVSALRLQYERFDLDHLSQEVRRRLTWSVMLIDGYFSVGLPESGTCHADFIYLKMPCSEEDFHAEPSAGGLTKLPQALDGVPEDGLLQRYVRLSIIRRDVMRLKRHLAVQANAAPQTTLLVEEMLRSLKAIEPSPPYSVQGLRSYAGSRWFLRYLALHIGWHQTHCDIYRLFLTGYEHAAPEGVIQACAPAFVAEAASACLRHARASTEIIHGAHRLPAFASIISPPRDICIGGYHASRLLLFVSSSKVITQDQNISLEEATTAAKQTLEILRVLFSSHAVLGTTVQDLDRIITSLVPGAPDLHRDLSDAEQQTSGCGRRARFAVAIQKHAHLGVHSALRHARFLDDDEEGGEMANPGRVPNDACDPAAAWSTSHVGLSYSDSSNGWAKSFPVPQEQAVGLPHWAPLGDLDPYMMQSAWGMDL